MNLEETAAEKLPLEQENHQLKATIGQLRSILQSHDTLSESTGTVYSPAGGRNEKKNAFIWDYREFALLSNKFYCFTALSYTSILTVNMLN